MHSHTTTKYGREWKPFSRERKREREEEKNLLKSLQLLFTFQCSHRSSHCIVNYDSTLYTLSHSARGHCNRNREYDFHFCFFLSTSSSSVSLRIEINADCRAMYTNWQLAYTTEYPTVLQSMIVGRTQIIVIVRTGQWNTCGSKIVCHWLTD